MSADENMAEEGPTPGQEAPSSSIINEVIEEGNEDAANPLTKSDSLPILHPLPLALPAPNDWKPNNDTFTDVLDENGHKYVGLTNQCQTCYLNSLIQTLYMVPEFRNTIYRIEPKANSKGIHIQLQKLFVQLQTSSKLSIPTVDLTESFGWQNEQLYQHDVQELFRVLIEALEKRWEKTSHKGCIETLFKGHIIDYIKCLNCETFKSKPDIFLDLSLAIKPDGEMQKPYKSLEESLTAFIKPEILDGNNKYKCEKCDSLEDAEKGLALKQYPPILAIQLKRYGFDYHTLHRIKLNDRLTFPDFLDLNKFLYKEPEPPKPKMSYAQIVSKPSTSSKPNETESPPTNSEKADDDSGWINQNADSEEVQEMLQNGPYIYELFSVLIHQGSANGGHYFSYIKNLDQQKWFCFNDSTVSHATWDDVKKTFGGTSHLGFNSSNAYMLMYRRIDPEKNETFIRTVDLPEHMKTLLEQIEHDEMEIETQRRLEKEQVTVHVVCNDQSTISESPVDLILHKDISFAELRHELCSNHPTINESDCRLLQCTSNWEIQAEFNEDSNEPPLNNIHRQSYYKPEAHIMIDTKQGIHFYDIPPKMSCKTADVHLVHLDKKTAYPAKRVCFDVDTTVGELKGHLCVIPEVRVCDPLNLRIVFDAYQDRNQPMVLWDDNQMEIKKLARLIKGENLQLYIDVGTEKVLREDRAIEKYEDTLMHSILERKKYNQRLTVWLPSADDFARANLPVPDFENLPATPKRVETIEEAGSKELSVDETDSSNGGESDLRDENIVDKPTDGPANDFVPPDPFCSITNLNIDASSSARDPESALSASSTYSSTNSNVPSVFVQQESEPLDPVLDSEQMEDLIKTSSSTYEEGPPPPPYSVATSSDYQSLPSTSNDMDAQPSIDENDDGVSLGCGETPRRSPNVSDDENGDNEGGSKHDEYNYKMHVFDKSEKEGLDLSNNGPFEADEPFSNFFGLDKTPASVDSTNNLIDCSDIQILDKSFETDCMKMELNLDRRRSLKSLHDWFAAYLGIDKSNIQIYKFYREYGDGFSVNLQSAENVQNVLSDIDHVCIKLTEKSNDDRSFIKGRDQVQNPTSFRRERQLRIKLASESND